MSEQQAGGPPIGGVGQRGLLNGWVLETDGLTKQFGQLTAVDNLSIRLQPGEVLGFLGPNGSGKSTTVGMILGLVRPTRGVVKIAGKANHEHPEVVSQTTGAIIENPAFYPYMSGRDNLKALAIAAGNVPDTRIDDLLKLVNMTERAGSKYKTYSLGMKQRLGIAATLVTDPAIVILDEPTNGLDPAGQREIRSIIPRLAEEGHAVLLASHMLHEVEQVSDRVAIIRRGKMLQEGRVGDLLASGGYIEISVAPNEVGAAAEALSRQPWVERVEAREAGLHVSAPADSGSAINRALVEAGIYAGQIATQRNTLEDLFLELTEPTESDAAGGEVQA
ncbi:MAG: ABC transporter ATP-binding protein [Thermomicrobiales bacterium]|nr:ABC transporter ATP-binding protein [Thermomicrobiales bacterium]